MLDAPMTLFDGIGRAGSHLVLDFFTQFFLYRPRVGSQTIGSDLCWRIFIMYKEVCRFTWILLFLFLMK